MVASWQTRTQSLFKCTSRAPQANPQSSLIPKKNLNSDWVRVSHHAILGDPGADSGGRGKV